MQCTRCQGFMVPHDCYNLLDGGHPTHIQAWRCVMCGDLVDPIILANRRRLASRKAAPEMIEALSNRSAA